MRGLCFFWLRTARLHALLPTFGPVEFCSPKGRSPSAFGAGPAHRNLSGWRVGGEPVQGCVKAEGSAERTFPAEALDWQTSKAKVGRENGLSPSFCLFFRMDPRLAYGIEQSATQE